MGFQRGDYIRLQFPRSGNLDGQEASTAIDGPLQLQATLSQVKAAAGTCRGKER